MEGPLALFKLYMNMIIVPNGPATMKLSLRVIKAASLRHFNLKRNSLKDLSNKYVVKIALTEACPTFVGSKDFLPKRLTHLVV